MYVLAALRGIFLGVAGVCTTDFAQGPSDGITDQSLAGRTELGKRRKTQYSMNIQQSGRKVLHLFYS